MNSTSQVFEIIADNEHIKTGLLVCCGGFEERSVSFAKNLHAGRCDVERTALIHYKSQQEDNEANFIRIFKYLHKATQYPPNQVNVDATEPIPSYEHIKEQVKKASDIVSMRKATIDISGMTHMWALGVIHACLCEGFDVDVVYAEAQRYFPLKQQAKPLLNAWISRDYDEAAKYFQSTALKSIQILPDFAGNFRPDYPTCLIVFAGYEPNRLEGLIDSYAPGGLVVLYGLPPRQIHSWRTDLSRKLHEEMFSHWPHREDFCSTLYPGEAIAKLEAIFAVVGSKYDLAVSPHCSKMQGIASYVFWRMHPEVQLIFTSPVRFRPSQYSKGEGPIHIYHLTSALQHPQ